MVVGSEMVIDAGTLIGEFVSTFKEWHYLVVGLSLGALVGYVTRDILGDYFK